MLRRLREVAPAGLVPLAWGFTVAAHLALVTTRTVLVAHVVMDVLLVAFAALSWSEMAEDLVLRAWRAVIVAGLGLTLVGTATLAGSTPEGPLATATVVGWALLPAVAFGYTARRVPVAWPYLTGAALSLVGAGCYLLGVASADAPDAPLALAGLGLVGVGQTVGIVDAAVRY
jgi:hypothetical protein